MKISKKIHMQTYSKLLRSATNSPAINTVWQIWEYGVNVNRLVSELKWCPQCNMGNGTLTLCTRFCNRFRYEIYLNSLTLSALWWPLPAHCGRHMSMLPHILSHSFNICEVSLRVRAASLGRHLSAFCARAISRLALFTNSEAGLTKQG